MAEYRPPSFIVPVLPSQGDWSFLPQIKVFGPYAHTDMATLETDVNQWYADWVPIPDERIFVLSTEITSSQLANNDIQVILKVSYFLAENT